jgi:NTP pyrophosphatase (non-canonical NTP hydrolase)
MADALSEMTDRVRQFCEERNWDQFHTPKELAIGLVTEASELLDLFRFQSPDQIKTQLEKPESRSKIEDELADVLFFLLRFAQRNQVDLKNALENKIAKNALKYPVETAYGSNQKYTR